MKEKRTVLILDRDAYTAGLYARKFEQEKWQVKIVDDLDQALSYLKSHEPEAFVFDHQSLSDLKVDAADFAHRTRRTDSLLAVLIEMDKVVYPDQTVEEYEADTYLLKGHFVPSEAVAKISRLVDEAED
ncbi:hypothetical protein KJ611_00295 [Patescibacteria group bacterium]|nr:hypothetical protein [Patescibacteria group bacterium]MBU1705187.1 hypothetical protein [Patescibacteria group bacterium]